MLKNFEKNSHLPFLFVGESSNSVVDLDLFLKHRTHYIVISAKEENETGEDIEDEGAAVVNGAVRESLFEKMPLE